MIPINASQTAALKLEVRELQLFSSACLARPVIATIVGELLLSLLGEQPKPGRPSSWYTKERKSGAQVRSRVIGLCSLLSINEVDFSLFVQLE